MNKGGAPAARRLPHSRTSEYAGFTIVETLIVLAVTGFLLLSAFAIISGRQAATAFTTSVNDFQQQLQQLINQSQKGYYPNPGGFKCTASAGNVSFGATGGQLGQNGGCLFLGTVVQFGMNGGTGEYIAYPVAGSDLGANGIENTTLQQTNPKVIDLLKTTTQLGDGLTVASMYYNTTANTIGAFGVLAGNGDANGTFAQAQTAGLASGSEVFSLYAITGTSLTNEAQLPNAFQTSGNRVAAASVGICVASGSKSALITIGGTNGLGVQTQMKSGGNC